MSPTSSAGRAAATAATIPLLSLRTYRTDPSLFVSQLRDAARTVGFFLLRHDLPPGIAASALEESRTFFARADEEKRSIRYEDTGGTFRGYVRLGAENTAGRVDMREQVEYGTDDHSRPSERRGWPPYERLRGRNPWPESVQPSLRPAMEAYVEGAMGVASSLREALCLGLGVEREALDGAFERGPGPYWQLKLVSYPAAGPGDRRRGDDEEDDGEDEDEEEEEEEASRQGVGAHTDSNFLTLVLQDDAWDDAGEGCGLQVFLSEDDSDDGGAGGRWIDLPPGLGPDVLVCNIGEQAEIVSGGYYRATPHRVVVPKHFSDRARTSVPFFYNPDLTVRLDELPLSGRDGGVHRGEDGEGKEGTSWRKGKKNQMMSTVGENLFKSLARSHPGVFRRHHGDLQVLEDGRIVSVEEKGED